MNTRLSQDAADTWQAYEQQQKWRSDVLARQEASRPSVIVGSFQHFPDEASLQRHLDWIKQHEATLSF